MMHGQQNVKFIHLSPTKLRTHNVADKAALKCGSEVWVLKETEEQRLEETQRKIFKIIIGNY